MSNVPSGKHKYGTVELVIFITAFNETDYIVHGDHSVNDIGVSTWS